MPSILLIDDRPKILGELAADVKNALERADVEIRTWLPAGNGDPREHLDKELKRRPTLVVTDYDLTAGQTGLFGNSIVAWCQQKAVPVADYSRQNFGELPREPDLFEIRVPRETEPGHFIASVFSGFESIGRALEADKTIGNERSAAAALARILGVPQLEADLALYAMRLAPASGALTSFVADRPKKNGFSKLEVLAYVAGHLLLNAVLRYPGPILSSRALGAYLATDAWNDKDLVDLFDRARYSGPFSQLDAFYWMDGVDAVLVGALPQQAETETIGELNRRAVEKLLGRDLVRHGCPRCKGVNGGFLCPFTGRTVCTLPTCSVGSNSWIPEGARICRIERPFFDEWGPVLGL